jgi:oligopeptide/dipeptide ABC transporter ATP-binding protein
MYAGRIVEEASTTELFARPLHPYTRALLRSMPTLGAHRDRLEAIPGNVPDITRRPSGCAFRDRCEQATAECAAAPPPLVAKGAAHTVACIHV